jgi:hypothetical protein
MTFSHSDSKNIMILYCIFVCSVTDDDRRNSDYV